MALSNYLTYDEYAMIWAYAAVKSEEFNDCKSLGDVMVKAIRTLYSKGIQFEGVDEEGNKKKYIGDEIVAMVFADLVFGAGNGVLFNKCIDDGIKLLKDKGILSEDDINRFYENIAKKIVGDDADGEKED